MQHFVAACNANDIVSDYLDSGKLAPKASVQTLSNAMDVGNPSNFVRILELFNHEHLSLKNILTGYSISDNETIATIKEVKNKYGYLLDPHGAVGFASLQRYLDAHKDEKGYFLETAHPVKFEVGSIVEEDIELPVTIQSMFNKDKKTLRMKAGAEELKEFLLSRQISP